MTRERMPASSDGMERIQHRVGLTGPDRLHWVVTFAQRNLDTLTQGEAVDLPLELRVFLASPYPIAEARRFPRLPSLTWEEVRAIQTAFRNILQQLVSTGRTLIKIPELSLVLSYTPHPPRTTVLLETTESTVKALYALTHLLGAHGALLRQCPDPKCHRIFVASRPRQRYCSARCLSRSATREYRQREKKGGR